MGSLASVVMGRFGAALCVLCMALVSPTVAQQPDEPYKVGAEDQITITVARHPEFSGTFFVPADGAIELPAAGRVQVSGKTLQEISETVAVQLRDRLKQPEVVTSLQTPRMQRVYVLGSVEKPNLYDMKPGWRITEAVAAAGGLPQGIEASDCRAILLRARDGQREAVELAQVLSGATDKNVRIESGDVLTIEAQETIPVYVNGRVKNPSLYRLRKDSAGLMQAITLAGGPLEDAAMTNVSVTHLNGKSEVLDLAPAILGNAPPPELTLMPGDSILVPEETARVVIYGYVREPGSYPLKNGQALSLLDAIGLAKGTEKRAELSAVALIRVENGKQQRQVHNLHKFMKDGDMASNPTVKAGDIIYVSQTKRPDWDFITRSLTAVGIIINPFVP